MTDEPTTPETTTEDDKDVEGHRVGHPGGHEPQLDPGPDGLKATSDEDESGIGPDHTR